MVRSTPLPNMHETTMADELDDDEARALRATRIIETVAAIPRGRVASYGAIAARAGYPGRARLVGRVLGDAPDRMKLPWHRVLRADGRIGIPVGTRGYREQCRLLKAEGVTVKDGRVPMSAFGLDHDLDRAIWGG
ncbi:methylated-DNA-protein-cysteine methyltransferase related protein [Luteibacter sp. 22Crub2.1]|nr:methylated-DNA-protein-cysteine methyltransferase related protein [Luteibacter sp. 22Crub2.1]